MTDVYIIYRDIVGYGSNMNHQDDLGVSRNGVYRPRNDHSNISFKSLKHLEDLAIMLLSYGGLSPITMGI